MSLSFFGAAAGLLMTSRIHPGTSYGGGIVPGMIVLGVFCGLGFPASANAALHQVTGQGSSLASGVQNAMQQAGGALGLACLATLALAFRIGAVLLVVGGVLALALFEHVTAQPRNPAAELAAEPPAAGPAAASRPLRRVPPARRASPIRRGPDGWPFLLAAELDARNKAHQTDKTRQGGQS